MKRHGFFPKCLLLLTFMAAASLGFPSVEDGPEIKEFNARVQKYIELHNQVASKVQPKDRVDDPQKVVQQKQEFIRAIQAARSGATQGDIFTPKVRGFFLEVIRGELDAPAGAKARAMILGEGNPRSAKSAGSTAPITLKVNAPYPTKAPMSTVPPSLLLALPKIPKELEYRFVGRNLILRDVDADLIVDFIANAVK
jgi:hypothetical protein